MQTVIRFFTIALVIQVLLLGSVQVGQAKNLYVDINGDDTYTGTSEDPWTTLQHAVDYAEPGDTILINEGTYAGFRTDKSGTEDAWITIKPNSGAKVVINRPGAENKHGSNLEFETWEWGESVNYWNISGLKINNADSYGIDIRGNEYYHSSHFNIEKNKVWNSGKSGIFTGFVDYVTVGKNRSFKNGEHGIYMSNSGDHYTVKGNKTYENWACGVQFNADWTSGGDGIMDDILIKNNKVYKNGKGGGAGINLDGINNAKVIKNDIYDNYAGGLSLHRLDGRLPSSNVLVKNNTIDMPEGSRWAINIKDHWGRIGYDFENITISQNTVTHADSSKGSIWLPCFDIKGFKSDHNQMTGQFYAGWSYGDQGFWDYMDWEEWQALGFDPNSTELGFE
jgi:hypothetical protein